MRSRAAGTIAAKSYLSLARVLAESFRRHHPEIPFFVLLADEVDDLFDPAQEPYQLLSLDDLGIPRPERFRFHHAQQPLSYAATPYLIDYLLDRGFESVLFFKQESLVVGDHAHVYELLEQRSILLTPHLLEPPAGADRAERELTILRAGVFNIGMVGVSATDTAREFLGWWKDRVYRDSRLAVAEGLHYEQRWIDLVPGFFEDVHILRDPGYNVAHWNLTDRDVRIDPGGITVNGGPGRLFRFSGFDPDLPDMVTRYAPGRRVDGLGPAAAIFRDYARLLDEAGYPETKHWPYAYGAFDNGVPIPEVARQIYLELGDAVDAFGDPFETAPPRSYFRWLNQPIPAEGSPSPVSRLWHGVYRRRVDVQQTFPDVLGADRDAFLRWAAASGAREHGISDAFPSRAAV